MVSIDGLLSDPAAPETNSGPARRARRLLVCSSQPGSGPDVLSQLWRDQTALYKSILRPIRERFAAGPSILGGWSYLAGRIPPWCWTFTTFDGTRRNSPILAAYASQVSGTLGQHWISARAFPSPWRDRCRVGRGSQGRLRSPDRVGPRHSAGTPYPDEIGCQRPR